MGVLLACLSVACVTCMCDAWGGQSPSGSLELQLYMVLSHYLMLGTKPLDPLEEQLVLLTTESSLGRSLFLHLWSEEDMAVSWCYMV